jgi:hypothetical protein
MNLINQSISQTAKFAPKQKIAIQEAWSVAGKDYSSSQDLLESGDRFSMDQAFYTRTELRSKSLGERVSGLAKNALIGGALATGLNAALAVATGGASIGVVSGVILLGGAALGAVSGATGKPTTSADGTMHTSAGKTHFYPDNVASRGFEVNGTDNGPALQANRLGLLA